MMTVLRLMMQPAFKIHKQTFLPKGTPHCPDAALQPLHIEIAPRFLERQCKKKETPSCPSVSEALQPTTIGDSELSYSMDLDASDLVGLEFISPRSTDADVARMTTPSGLWRRDDSPLSPICRVLSVVGTPPASTRWSCTSECSFSSVSLSDLTSDDLSVSLGAVGELEAGTPSASTGWSRTSACSFSSVSLSDLTSDDLTVSLEASSGVDTPISPPSSASGLHVLRRSCRIAGRLRESGGDGVRRSPRLALKPRVCYRGMC